MWFKEYKDYKIDTPLSHEITSADDKSIIGCQMNELNGWGEAYHMDRKKKKKGLFAILLEKLFSFFS